ncbi:MAG: alpha-glucosidase [Ligilactobacillus agilis]|nr:alpha-glucosidase [Ligilactobacillus agilis]
MLMQPIIYQIYPKSFQDSNHDGIGDLKGIEQRLDYLKDLGVTMLWLNPIYKSPQVDNGYDVADYYQIDSSFGTLADFKALVAAAHERGLKIIMDFVMNHTSDEHPWFKEALKGADNPYHDYYLWQTAPSGQLPNNWASFFGGSVWEPVGHNEYYFHLFDKRMPDLNWHNRKVRQEMVKIAQYWLNLGVDGFRLDAFIHIVKADFKQNVITAKKGPQIAEEYYANLPLVQEYLEEFISKLKQQKPDLFIIGEAASAEVSLGFDYTNPKRDLCDTVVTFRYFKEKPSPDLPALARQTLDLVHLKTELSKWQQGLGLGALPTLYWNNHDLPRVLSRFEVPSEAKEKLAKSLAVAMYLQRGIPCIYYGEELGLESLELKTVEAYQEKLELKQALAAGYSQNQIEAKLPLKHKMAARTPMPWDDTKVHQGFSDATPWLETKEDAPVTVTAQLHRADSCLSAYKQLLALKKTPLFTAGQEIILPSAEDLVVFERQLNNKRALVLANLSAKPQVFKGEFTPQTCAFKNGDYQVVEQEIRLAAYSSCVFINDEEEA